MKKVFILLLFLILNWCSFNWFQNNKNKNINLKTWDANKKISKLNQKIQELQKENEDYKKKTKNDFFQKNLECKKLTQELIKRTKQIEKEYNLWEMIFKEVFYSPKTNSCLRIRITEIEYSTLEYMIQKSLYEYWDDSWYSHPISSCIESRLKWEYKTTCNVFKEKVKEYKWK